MASCENEARFLHQNEVNLGDRKTKWPRFIPHAFAQTAQRKQKKLDLLSPIVDRDKKMLDLIMFTHDSENCKRLCIC